MTTRKKWLLGLPAALLVGALGSGLWNMALKPAVDGLGHAILTALTFGSSVYIDGIYKEAARGLHDHAANSLLLSIQLALVSITSGVIVGLLLSDLLESKLYRQDEQDEAVESRGQKRLRIVYIGCYGFLFAIGLNLVADIQSATATEVYSYFNQSLTICRPYISEKEYYSFASGFASVRSKADYGPVVAILKAAASANHLTLTQEPKWSGCSHHPINPQS